MQLPMTLDSRDFFLLERCQKQLKKDIEERLEESKNDVLNKTGPCKLSEAIDIWGSIDFKLNLLKSSPPNMCIFRDEIQNIASALLSITNFDTPENIIEAKREAYGSIEIIGGTPYVVINFYLTFVSEKYARELKEEYGEWCRYNFKWKTKKQEEF